MRTIAALCRKSAVLSTGNLKESCTFSHRQLPRMHRNSSVLILEIMKEM